MLITYMPPANAVDVDNTCVNNVGAPPPSIICFEVLEDFQHVRLIVESRTKGICHYDVVTSGPSSWLFTFAHQEHGPENGCNGAFLIPKSSIR